jgi:hypothetical protein
MKHKFNKIITAVTTFIGAAGRSPRGCSDVVTNPESEIVTESSRLMDAPPCGSHFEAMGERLSIPAHLRSTVRLPVKYERPPIPDERQPTPLDIHLLSVKHMEYPSGETLAMLPVIKAIGQQQGTIDHLGRLTPEGLKALGLTNSQ